MYQTRARGNPNAYSNWIWMQTARRTGEMAKIKLGMAWILHGDVGKKNWNQIFIDFEPDKPARSHFNTFYYLFCVTERTEWRVPSPSELVRFLLRSIITSTKKYLYIYDAVTIYIAMEYVWNYLKSLNEKPEAKVTKCIIFIDSFFRLGFIAHMLNGELFKWHFFTQSCWICWNKKKYPLNLPVH